MKTTTYNTTLLAPSAILAILQENAAVAYEFAAAKKYSLKLEMFNTKMLAKLSMSSMDAPKNALLKLTNFLLLSQPMLTTMQKSN